MKILLVLLLVNSSLFAAILGSDDRKEYFEASNKQQKLSISIAALLQKSMLVENASVWKFSLLAQTYEEWATLCPDEKFASQLNPASCSAFLIGPNRIATAGHCINKENTCNSIAFVFDYQLPNPEVLPNNFTHNQIYFCKSVIAHSEAHDFAVIELDRVVQDREPLKTSLNRPAIHTPLTMMGFPHGIPLKIVEGGSVQDNQFSNSADYFETDLDSFKGNSGSPVLNSLTNEVEGILSVGFGEFEEPILHPKTGKSCSYVRRWANAEEATYSWVARVDYLREFFAK